MRQPLIARVEIFREGDLYVGLCPDLDVSSYGKTIEEAKRSLQEALEAFVEECATMGTLSEVLEEAGFVGQDGTWLSRQPVSTELVAVGSLDISSVATKMDAVSGALKEAVAERRARIGGGGADDGITCPPPASRWHKKVVRRIQEGCKKDGAKGQNPKSQIPKGGNHGKGQDKPDHRAVARQDRRPRLQALWGRGGGCASVKDEG